jgi:molybdopterin/thiamine biosynthesis adenylyltransferase
MTATLRLTGIQYRAVRSHVLRQDRDEYGAIILAGVHHGTRGVRLLAREVHLLSDSEFTAGIHGYRQFSPAVLAQMGNRAAAEGLALVTLHSHPLSFDRTSLSFADRDGHRRIFPHLLDIVNGSPVAGIAIGQSCAAGEVWLADRTVDEVQSVDVIGSSLTRLTPAPPLAQGFAERFDRQARLFGAAGQHILRDLRVAVIGLGGGGSMVFEQLVHLGVGEILAIDFDSVQPHNLSRIVGATPEDADRGLTKVAVAERLAATIDSTVHVHAVVGDIADKSVARLLADCDFVFLATDTATSRLVANAVCHSYLVPTVQLGAKVDLRTDQTLESVYVAVRPVLPDTGCLDCAGLISPERLQYEAASAEERQNQNYLGLPDIVDPSVITLNGISASLATNTMLMWAVGLSAESLAAHRIVDALTGNQLELRVAKRDECPWCGTGQRSRFARGDAAALPLRQGK